MNLPRLGVFFSYIDMGNADILGESMHLGSYLGIPIHQKNKLDLEFRIGFGATYANQKFNLESNRKNTLYSTDMSGLGYVKFYLSYQLSKRFIASTGVGLLHFSNGSYRLPNLGANVLSANVGLYYKLNKNEINTYAREEKTLEKKAKYLLNIGTGIGWKATIPINDKHYPVYTLMLQVERKNERTGSWLFGLDLNKNTSLRDEQEYLDPEKTFKNDNRASLLGGYSLNLGKLSALGQLGIYVYSPVNTPRPFYQKIGFRYNIFNTLHVGLNLKAHAGVADFVEYVLTYKI